MANYVGIEQTQEVLNSWYELFNHFLKDRISDWFYYKKKPKQNSKPPHFVVNTPQKNVGIPIESAGSVKNFSKQKVEHLWL